MKRIEIVVSTQALGALRDALVAAGIARIAHSQIMETRDDAAPRIYRGTTYVVPSSARVKVEVTVLEDQIASTLHVVYGVARTGGFEMDITLVPIGRTIHVPARGHEREPVRLAAGGGNIA